MSMVRYKQSTGNIKVTADRIKYEIMGELSPMDLYIIDDIINTRDDVVIEGDNRAVTLILGLKTYLNLDVLGIDYDNSDSLQIELTDWDIEAMGTIEGYYKPLG